MRDNRLARLLFAAILAAMFCATCAKDESLPHPRFEVTEDVVFARTYREDGASVDRVMDVLRPVDDSSQARPALLCLHAPDLAAASFGPGTNAQPRRNLGAFHGTIQAILLTSSRCEA